MVKNTDLGPPFLIPIVYLSTAEAWEERKSVETLDARRI